MGDSEQLWALTILPVGSNIRQAVEVLNETSLRIVLVIDKNENLVGTISDGDIRRGLLKGLDLESPISLIVNREPITVAPDSNRDKVLKLMTINKLHQIPVVDTSKKVVGLHLWDEILVPQSRANTMVIMAGGMGTRLYPQTENCPKPMLAIAGRPILEHIITRARSEGFCNFVIAIHYLGFMIEEYFGNGEKFGVKISYLREESPLGTAGALSLLSPNPESTLIVTNGDVLTNIRYGEFLNFHDQQKMTATIAVRPHEWQNPFGVVSIEGIEIVSYVEKPVTRDFINAGVYAFNPQALSILEHSMRMDMSTLLQQIMSKGMQIAAYPVHEQWLDVGRPSDFVEAEKHFHELDTKRIL